jgi:drug/metabolite transporter (DMT)-like permease
MKVGIALSIAIIMGAAGDIFMSKGMKSRGEVEVNGIGDVLPVLKLVFTTPYVLLGITSMAVYFSSYIAALAWVDVSVANPMTALSYVIATGYALLYMRERVTPKRWLGVALITLGAIFVGLSC